MCENSVCFWLEIADITLQMVMKCLIDRLFDESNDRISLEMEIYTFSMERNVLTTGHSPQIVGISTN